MIEKSLLNLQLAQVERALFKDKGDRYSNKELDGFHKNLLELYHSLHSIITGDQYDEDSLPIYKNHIEFIFKSLEYLENSTLNLIPFELVYCLKLAINYWIDDENYEYIIVTNLSNNISSFKFDPWFVTNINRMLDTIKEMHNLKFDSMLVQVTLPKNLVRDYLTSIVLYHELGHFIDEKYQISHRASVFLINNIINGDTSEENYVSLVKYFHKLPQIGNIAKTEAERDDLEKIEKRVKFYIAEYFCDLFAAQYLGKGYMDYLSYSSQGSLHKHSTYHPSTICRSEVYTDFLKEKSNPIVDIIKLVISKLIPDKELKIRHAEITSEDFYKFLPIEISSEDQLHGIFSYGWSIWLSDWSKFQTVNKLNSPMSFDKVYSVVNNLLEKSIGNFIVKEQWQKALEY